MNISPHSNSDLITFYAGLLHFVDELERRLEKLRPKYSLVDFILSLISIGHFVYACVRQRACSSDPNYDSWRCYNAFGYRLYNYVLPNVISVLVQSCVQAYNTYIRSNYLLVYKE